MLGMWLMFTEFLVPSSPPAVQADAAHEQRATRIKVHGSSPHDRIRVVIPTAQ